MAAAQAVPQAAAPAFRRTIHPSSEPSVSPLCLPASPLPSNLQPGDTLTLQYNSSAPVTKALLLRTGAITHSMSFDQRALWLEVESNGNGSIALKTPPSSALLPPGM